MTFSLDAHWVWDFWLADDGDTYHLYYLHAPKTLGDQRLRHRNARIGHATSFDLITWTDLGPVLGPGGTGDFDETATWTGSVVRGADGMWRMFYTGSRFLSADSYTNIESIGVAKSSDLHNWTKSQLPVTVADPTWYETLESSQWHEEAWRDPWVFPDPAGDGWHMLITARADHGDAADRGVIAHATSPNLDVWQVQPPLTQPGTGYAHLEVPQTLTIDGRHLLLFSCDTASLAGGSDGRQEGGIWALELQSLTGTCDPSEATLLTGEELYSGRMIQVRDGAWKLLAFENKGKEGSFVGVLSDPIPVTWHADDPIPTTPKAPPA
jgi:beta-fructofuranosidase